MCGTLLIVRRAASRLTRRVVSRVARQAQPPAFTLRKTSFGPRQSTNVALAIYGSPFFFLFVAFEQPCPPICCPLEQNTLDYLELFFFSLPLPFSPSNRDNCDISTIFEKFLGECSHNLAICFIHVNATVTDKSQDI